MMLHILIDNGQGKRSRMLIMSHIPHPSRILGRMKFSSSSSLTLVLELVAVSKTYRQKGKVVG